LWKLNGLREVFLRWNVPIINRKKQSRRHFNDAVQWRRELHKHPQPAWLEFFATGFIAEKLTKFGYEVKLGRDIIDEQKQLLLPNEEKLQVEYESALKDGIKEEFIAPAKGGFTGVVGIFDGIPTRTNGWFPL